MSTSVANSTHRLGWAMLAKHYANSKGSDGVIVSPLSATIALAMLAGGADSPKRAALYAKLGIQSSGNLNELKLGDVSEVLTVANAIFTSKGYILLPAYVKHLKNFNVHEEQFPSLAGAAEQINAWVSGNTNGMIQDMVSAGDLAEAHLVLMNALAFKGLWESQFDPQGTIKGFEFRVSRHKVNQVDMMFKKGPHLEVLMRKFDDGYTAVRLPYKAKSRASRFSLIAYLPHEDKTLEQILPKISFSSSPEKLTMKKLDLFGFPKFNIQTEMELMSLLPELGYPIDGDFPEMGRGVGANEVSAVMQKASIELDEEGTTAAAATAIVMGRSLKPSVELVFDRPFAFSIVADATDVMVLNGVFSSA